MYMENYCFVTKVGSNLACKHVNFQKTPGQGELTNICQYTTVEFIAF